ncbi:hypothetical protein [Cereibacter johrii]|uniref:hypothetical protein n=1 Tax=Cereibacter johrii TaxID=445629 RepID=UPI000DCC65BC|nr:hypothetical protein [Cereibacter johrii]RAZ83690.1 hypothetical protein DDV93_15455 [Cereibacter johrii]
MPAPPDLARHPALDAAARAVLALLEPLDRREGLARLEALHAAAAPGPARRALLAARIALLRGAPALALAPVRPEPEPEPEPPAPEPPAPKPVVIPQLDLSAMMALFEDAEEEPAADAAPPDEGWTKIRLTEDGPRGPAQFPKGAALSVTLEDAARLLTAGVAEEMETDPAETELPPPDAGSPQEAAVADDPDAGAPSETPPQTAAPAPRRSARRKTAAGAASEGTAMEETAPRTRASRPRRSRGAAAKDPGAEPIPAEGPATGLEEPPSADLDMPTQAAFVPPGGKPFPEVPAAGRLRTPDAAAFEALTASEDPAAVDAAGTTAGGHAPEAPHLNAAAAAAVGPPESPPPAEPPAAQKRPKGFDPAALAALAAFGDPDPAEEV